MDIYDKAYNATKRMLGEIGELDDIQLQQMMSKLSDEDYGTLYDRLADMYVQSHEDFLVEVTNWLMVNTSLGVEKIVDLKEHFLNNKQKKNK